jgi:two-component system response regulator AlgR
MKLMVVDDEALARQRLRHLLSGLVEVASVSEAADGEEALALQQQQAADIILLDIRMPGIGGLETARRLAQLPRPPVVIFTTAYGEHALEAFEAEALDYLVKPVRIERLQQALERARRARPELRESPRLTVRKHGELHLIALDEVIYFQADHKYVTAYLAGREELLEESLKQLEEAYPDRLLRVHRNALVAVHALEGLEKQGDGGFRVVLKGLTEGPEVSRRHLAELRRRLRAG